MAVVETVCRWGDCDEEYETVSDLGWHILHQHVKGQKAANRQQKTSGYFCRWEGCERHDKPFKGCYNLEHHVRYQHTKEKPFTCDRSGCNSSFSQNSDLKEHLRKRHKEIVPKISKRSRTSTIDSPAVSSSSAVAHLQSQQIAMAAPSVAISQQAPAPAPAVLPPPPQAAPRPTKKPRVAVAEEQEAPPIIEIKDLIDTQILEMSKKRAELEERLHFPIVGLVSPGLLLALQDPSTSLVVPTANISKNSLYYLL